jgi:RNA polymerase sigma-70 factor (family 1)
LFDLAHHTLHNELETIRLVTQGDEKAFAILFYHYKDKLYTYALRLTDEAELAEEMVQDVFLKIWTNRAELKKIDSIDAYLFTIIRNKSYNAIKKRAHEAVILKELSFNMTEMQNSTEETVIVNNYQTLLQKVVSQLPPQQKLIYDLSRSQGLKHEEIAQKLQISKNTVKVHLVKALHTIRSAFYNHAISIGGWLLVAIQYYFK